MIFNSYDIHVYHRPINISGSLLVHTIDKADMATKCGVVYETQCPDGNHHYTEGTRSHRVFITYQRCEHTLNTDHRCSMSDVKILDLG